MTDRLIIRFFIKQKLWKNMQYIASICFILLLAIWCNHFQHLIHFQWLCEMLIDSSILWLLDIFRKSIGAEGNDWNRWGIRRESPRIAFAASRPFITGIIISIRMMSYSYGFDFSKSWTASSPLMAVDTLSPAASREKTAISRFSSLSSTTRIWRSVRSAGWLLWRTTHKYW